MTSTMLTKTLAGALIALAGANAFAQYTRPGAVLPQAQVPARPQASAPSGVAKPAPAIGTPSPPAAQTNGPGLQAPYCFEVMDARDSTLISTLKSYGLLCATSTRTGDQLRLRATSSGDLVAGDAGPPTVWHRAR